MTTTAAPSGRFLFSFLLLILVWAPLPVGSNRPWALWLLIGLINLLASGWLVQYLRGRVGISAAFRMSWVPLLLLGLIQLWVFLQLTLDVVATNDPWATTVRLYQGLAYTTFFGLVLLLVNSKQRIRYLCYAIVLGGVFQAAYGSFMTMSGLEYAFFYKKEAFVGLATGTFFARPHMAGFLVLCLAVGIGLLLADMERHPAHNWKEFQRRVLNTLLGPKFRLRLYLAIMVIGLVLTRSRMGNAAFFTSLLSMGFLTLILQRRVTRNALLLFGSLLLIDALILGNWFGFEKVIDRIEQTSTATEARDDISVYTYQMWQDNWWTGTGAGSFYSNFPRWRGSDVNGYWAHAHNDYVELGAEYGVIGFTPMVLFVASSFWAAIQAQRRRRSRLLKSMGFSASMAVVWLVMSSAVDFNMHIPANALTFLTIVALGWIALYLPENSSVKRTPIK